MSVNDDRIAARCVMTGRNWVEDFAIAVGEDREGGYGRSIRRTAPRLDYLMTFAALALLSLLQTAPVDDQRVEPLTLAQDPVRACDTQGRWCVGVIQVGEEAVVMPVARPAGQALPEAPQDDSGAPETYEPWPGLVRLNDGFLAGIQVRTSSMYSGGGGSATEVRLFKLDAFGDATGEPILIAPVQGSLSIRACFSETDEGKRAGACHDEYTFEGRLTAADAASGGWPIFDYATTATAYPRGVSRSEDSLEMAPLKPADLVAERDPKCSFERRFTFDAEAGAYRPDRPLPDCSDYTVP